ncbi:MAG TPA: T9SS type A sorting domain-containing protein, partial [Bacteroidia bacterium]|nr:T9SS type A sorting domain-containing protein [Bacteroidia bacterium]
MKKILYVCLAFIITNYAHAQSIVLQENFTTYDSTTASIPAGWILSYTGNGSYYTSTTSSGPSGPNSYKFGVDSATVTTPAFTNADSVHFWMRGNGTDSLSTLTLNYTTDLISWNLLTVIYPVNNVSATKHYALPAGTKQLQFMYSKSLGNVAFDDFSVTANVSGIYKTEKVPYSIYPMPAKNVFYTAFNEPQKNTTVTLYNVLGRPIKTQADWI